MDDSGVYSKMHRFETVPGRLVMLSAGNLATTQAVGKQIERDLGQPDGGCNFGTTGHLDEIAEDMGPDSRRPVRRQCAVFDS